LFVSVRVRGAYCMIYRKCTCAFW